MKMIKFITKNKNNLGIEKNKKRDNKMRGNKDRRNFQKKMHKYGQKRNPF